MTPYDIHATDDHDAVLDIVPPSISEEAEDQFGVMDADDPDPDRVSLGTRIIKVLDALPLILVSVGYLAIVVVMVAAFVAGIQGDDPFGYGPECDGHGSACTVTKTWYGNWTIPAAVTTTLRYRATDAAGNPAPEGMSVTIETVRESVPGYIHATVGANGTITVAADITPGSLIFCPELAGYRVEGGSCPTAPKDRTGRAVAWFLRQS